MSVHRVAHEHEALVQPIEQPFGIVCGDVGATACAEDHGFPFRVTGNPIVASLCIL
jgi:hypothetical protein